ncbi:hypothetical protein N7474_003088 [Penicillium riverlandense]|uniref:uncharacterized protein n=1 Tax=Penicillium riverlandense TaxID=1903569 RepID=UPI002547E5C2|nr:uncharacterized protein N7474_003088 [Penicillium riverlandense]KAJ5825950.1 hypothetical protein N7474_003088 [Penicillium riverlandense]
MHHESQVRNAYWSNPHIPRLAGDLAAATSSAILVTPAVAIIDRAIVEKSSFNQPLLHGLRRHAVAALRQPACFVFQRPFGIVFALYAATYSVANITDTLSHKFQDATARTITFATTMMVNVPLALWKDIRFAQVYGIGRGSDATIRHDKVNEMISKTRQGSVPFKQNRIFARAAGAIFLIRDGVTIFGSFTLAPWLSAAIPDSSVAHPNAKPIITQLTVPVFTQLVATPLHLLALDMYMRQYTVPFVDRIKHSQQHLPSSTALRCVRIIPAFGIGCLTNLELRSFFHEKFRA